MISAPSSSACCVPWAAPCGLPPSSLIRSWMFGFWNSASAISAEFRIDCAARAALPDADSGSSRPTLTWPLPATIGCCAGPEGAAGGCEANGLENWPRVCCTPAQAPSRGAPSTRPIAVRRVAPEMSGPEDSGLGLSGPTMVSLLLTDRDQPERAPPIDQEGWIQAYCRRIVNQNKRIMAAPSGHQLQKIASPPLYAASTIAPDGFWQLWRRGLSPI